MLVRELERDELLRIWSIDRREVIENVYHLVRGKLVLKPEYHTMRTWPLNAELLTTPILERCFERGGAFFGAFEEGKLVGVAVLDNAFMGKHRDQLQLVVLQVSHDYRRRGLGRLLFELAVERARELNARRLFISAAPSENTVNFYIHLGCVVADDIGETHPKLQSGDIPMEYLIPPSVD